MAKTKDYKYLLLHALCMFFHTGVLFSQSDSLNQRKYAGQKLMEIDYVSIRMEDLAESMGDDIDLSEVSDAYAYYLQHKININQADYDVLSTVFHLSDYQVYHLKRYLELYGPMQSMYELMAVEGFNKETVMRLLPFVDFLAVQADVKSKVKEYLKYGENTILLRYTRVLEASKGFRGEKPYEGKQGYYLLKYAFNYQSRLRFGLTAEKDPGETFFKGSNPYGFDFYSFHFFYKGSKYLQAIALGDFNCRFGQGLVFSSGFRLPIASNATAAFSSTQIFTPYTSSNEHNYLRGAAVQLKYKHWSLSLFGSYRNKDANLSDTTLTDEINVLSLQTTGLHRTQTEVENEKTIKQFTSGSCVQYNRRVFRIGAGVFYSRLNHPLNRNIYPYNQFAFNQQQLLNASVYYQVLIKKLSLFGENALSNNGGFALLNGCVFYLDPMFTLSLLHRYYAVNFQAIQSNAYAQSTSNSNETGLLFACHTILNKHLNIDAYLDYCKFMWLKYRVDAPSDAYEISLKVNIVVNDYCNIYVRYRNKSKAGNQSTEYYNQIADTKKQSLRLHASFLPFPAVCLTSSVEYVVSKTENIKESKKGFLIYQDVKLTYKPFTLTARFALFDTDDYDTRIYAYENDLLYAASMPAYYNNGNRVYFMLKTEITKHIDVWCRFSQTFHRNKQFIGSGNNRIDKNHKTDMRLQLIITF